jgi:hypothetical protein
MHNKEVHTPLGDTLKDVELGRHSKPVQDNFSFKDSIGMEEHIRMPEIRESMGVRNHFI